MKKKIKSVKTIAKGIQLYPDSAEREYARLLSGYYAVVAKALLPKIQRILRRMDMVIREDARMDERFNFKKWMKQQIVEMYGDADDLLSTAQLNSMLERVSKIAETASVNDWLKMCEQSMGVKLEGAYYDEALASIKEAWVKNNVSYIKSLPEEMLDDVKDVILWGYETKQPLVNVYHRLEKLGIGKSQARRLARDQIGTLSYQFTRAEHESIGVEEYLWKTRRDGRVRPCHAALNNTIHRWDNPPEMWYITKAGIVYSGRRCHPSQDYGCRCTAVPVFNNSTLKKAEAVRDGRN